MWGLPLQMLNFTFRDMIKGVLPAVSQKDSMLKKFFTNVLAGAMAGGLSMGVVYPLDFIKVRMALDMGVDRTREFISINDVANKIYASDGIRGLYRGYCVSILGVVLYRGAYFGLFDTGRASLDKNASMLSRWMMAQAVTNTAGFIAYPISVIRNRLLLQSGVPPE
jgi:solute carrier family 25 (mitochondrial adenine nucleotide translocator), member 4/5/6/31